MKTDSKEILASLEEYGLSRNEASIYIFLLKKLEATAFEVAKETTIPRTTVYATLESLKKQGFISQFKRNNVAYFTPESPSRLVRLLKDKEEIINSVMPQIQAIASRQTNSPVTKLYVGIDGIKHGLEDILETLKKHKIKQIYATSQADLLKFLPKYFPDWLKRREELGVFTKLILPSTASNYLKTNELREVRYLPEKFPFTTSVTMYGNKMAFFSLEGDDPYCVIVESASITGLFSQFFLFSWETLKI
jgi:sugar-specific transcriptional regulator TrmB